MTLKEKLYVQEHHLATMIHKWGHQSKYVVTAKESVKALKKELQAVI
jgi:hypothetical protein